MKKIIIVSRFSLISNLTKVLTKTSPKKKIKQYIPYISKAPENKDQ